MAYLVSARKYRPQLFEELIGQEHIAGTLSNAILKGRVGHAYLFSGPRGIGKTSAARIFAKALNCEKGPTPNPCGVCVFCREIVEGRALDLVEIDGASNRRVDEVRQLRENVRFVPSAAKYKIYIIDEVHMLTTEAFNALLKTLEEPPEHVVFVFATTEVNKVPHTIRSRCQQFVFKRIPVPLIMETLKRICSDLSAQAEERALFWIAKGAQGSMRDAESILDQMISFGGGVVKERDVFYVLGIPGYDVYHRFGESIAAEDADGCLTLLDGLLDDGLEVGTLLSGMIEYYRNLYVLATSRGAEDLVDLPVEDLERMRGLMDRYSPRDIHNILTVLSRTYLDVRSSDLSRELFEIALMKLARYRDIINPAAILKRLEELQGELGGRAGTPGGAAAPAAFAVPSPAGDGVRTSGGESPSTAAAREDASRERSSGKTAPVPGGRGMPSVQAAPGEAAAAGTGAGTSPGRSTGPTAGPTAVTPTAATPLTPDSELFARIVSHLSKSRRALAEFLSKASRCTSENNVLTFVYDQSEKLGFQHVSEESARRYIERAANELVQKEVRVRFVVEQTKNEQDRKVDQVRSSPGVSKVLDIFKGDIVPDNDHGGV